MQRIVCIFLSTIGAYYGAKKQAQIKAIPLGAKLASIYACLYP
jgi:hypothetical protein